MCIRDSPSYAIRLAEVFQAEGLDPKGTTLKTLVIGAEPHTDEQRRKIEKMLGVPRDRPELSIVRRISTESSPASISLALSHSVTASFTENSAPISA